MNRKEYQKQWREKNKDKIKAYQKEYQQKNRDTIKKKVSEYGKKWYQKNREKKDAQGKKWHQNNRKRSVEIVQKYVRNNKEKVTAYNKKFGQSIDGRYRLISHRHNKRWDTKLFTKEEYVEISSMPCKYCGGKNITKGIDRMDSTKGYAKENSASCCKVCNYMKREYTIENFINHIEKIYKHNLCE